MDFDSMTREELALFLQEVFEENERRRDLDEIPGRIAGLLARYSTIGGDPEALDPLVRQALHDELNPPEPEPEPGPTPDPEPEPEPTPDPDTPPDDA